MAGWKSIVSVIFLFWVTPVPLGMKAYAYESGSAMQWVIDPHSVLSLASTAHLNLILAETAQKQGIYIHVFIIDEKPPASFDEQIQATLHAWEATHPSYSYLRESWAFVVINVSTSEGKVGLKTKSVYLRDVRQGLYNLESLGIMPALQEGDLEKAIFQGVIGLGTLLKEPALIKSHEHMTSLAFHIFILGLMFSLVGIGVVFILKGSPFSFVKTHDNMG